MTLPFGETGGEPGGSVDVFGYFKGDKLERPLSVIIGPTYGLGSAACLLDYATRSL